MKRWSVTIAVLLALGLALLLFQRQRLSTVQLATVHSDASASRAALDPDVVRTEPTHAAETPASAPSSSSAAAPATQSTPSEILVRGMLRDEQGQPAENANLRWVERNGNARLALGTHGTYSIAGLHPGHYMVVLGGDDYRREEIDVELAAQPEVQSRDFVFHPGMRFPIRIVDAEGSTPLGPGSNSDTQRAWGLTVRATRAEPPTIVIPLLASSNQNSECGVFLPRRYLEPGHEDLGLDVLGMLRLDEAPPLFVSLAFGSALVATRRIEEVPKELVFVVEPERLRSLLAGVRARLVQADGRAPLSDTHVRLFSQTGGSMAKSDLGGHIEFLDQIPGEYELWIQAQNLQRRSAVLSPGQVLDLGDIVLRESAQLYVRFEFPTAVEPWIGFALQPADPGNPLGALDRPFGSLWSTRFGNRVAIPDPGPGSYDLIIASVGDSREVLRPHLGALPQRVVIGDTVTEDIVVKLEVTSTVALVPPRDPPPGVRWLISTSDGRPAQLVRIEGNQPKVVELPQGSYSILPVSSEKGFLDLIEPQTFTVGADSSAVELYL